MPRSNDGRWDTPCEQCGKVFTPRGPARRFCSQACSNKAFPGVGGSKPAPGLPERTCPVCSAQFQPYRASQLSCSRNCYRQLPHVAEAARNSNQRPERKARKNELRRTSPRQVETVRSGNRRRQLAKYGLTVDDYARMLGEQEGVCKICGNPPNPEGVRAASRLHADHDHETGASRDLLCLNCNHGIGCFRDDPELLRAAAEYIERHRALTT